MAEEVPNPPWFTEQELAMEMGYGVRNKQLEFGCRLESESEHADNMRLSQREQEILRYVGDTYGEEAVEQLRRGWGEGIPF